MDGQVPVQVVQAVLLFVRGVYQRFLRFSRLVSFQKVGCH